MIAPRDRAWRSMACLLLVAMAVLAGCNAFPGSSPEDASVGAPAGNATPAPVPTDSPTPRPDPADVPGLSAAGVVDGEALLDAHVRALDARSYGLERIVAVTLDNGTTLNRTHTTARVGTDGRVSLRSVRVSPLAGDTASTRTERALWVGLARSFKALVHADGSTEYARVSQNARVERSLMRDTVGVVASLDADSSRIVRRVRVEGDVGYLIEGHTSWLSGTNATHRFLVDATGRIHRLTTTRTAVQDTEIETERFRVRYTGVGTTTVERPAWYDAALANTTGESGARAGTSPAQGSLSATTAVEDSTLLSSTATTRSRPRASNTPIRPNLTRAGVADPIAVSNAHVRQLDRTTFTYRSRTVERYANGTPRTRTVARGAFGPVGRGFNTTVERTATNETTVRRAWSDGQGVTVATTERNRTHYELALDPETVTPVSPRALLRFDPTPRERIAGLIGGMRVFVAEDETSSVYTLVAPAMERPDRIAAVTGLASVESARLTAQVAPSGLIRRYRFEYAGTTAAGATIQGVQRVRYTQVGTTSVERPGWYGAAVVATNSDAHS